MSQLRLPSEVLFKIIQQSLHKKPHNVLAADLETWIALRRICKSFQTVADRHFITIFLENSRTCDFSAARMASRNFVFEGRMVGCSELATYGCESEYGV